MKTKIMQAMAVIMIHLVLLLPVSVVSALTISEVETNPSTDYVVLKWKTDELSDSTAAVRAAGEDEVKTETDSELVTSHELVVQELQADTFYEYDLVSSYPSEPDDVSVTRTGSFSTLDLTLPEKITGLEMVEAGQDFIKIKWSQSTADDFSKYLIYRNDQKIKEIASLGTTEFKDTGLSAATNYKYKIAAADISGNQGGFSDVLSVQTLQADSNAPILTNLRIAALTGTQATITWTTDEKSTTILSYGVSGSSETTLEDTNLALEHSISASGLTAGQLYSYKAKSCDQWGNCNFLEDSFIAGADAVSPTFNLEIPEFINEKKVIIRGVTEPFSEVKFFVNGIYKGFVSREFTGETGIVEYNLGGFSEGENLLKVVIKDGAGNENTFEKKVTVDTVLPQYTMPELPSFSREESLVIAGTTSEPVKIDITLSTGEEVELAKVTGLRATEVKSNSAEIEWDINEEEEAYKYAIYRNGVLLTTWSDNKFTDPALSTDKEYVYEVSAVSESCSEGPKSDPLTIRTKPNGAAIDDVITPETICETSNPEVNEYVTQFEETLDLEKGANNVRIVFIDRAGNYVEVKKKIYFDNEPPVIDEGSLNLDQLNPSYIPDVTVRGKVSKKAFVFIIVNDKLPGDEEAADTDEPEGESSLIDDILSGIDKTKTFSAETDDEGNFAIPITLRRDPLLAYDSDGNRIETQTSGKTASFWRNEIEIFAIDSIGLKSESVPGEIDYALCGMGGDWNIKVSNVMPSDIVPRHLIEGFAQFGFNIDLEWQGIDEERIVTSARVIEDYPMQLNSETSAMYDTDWVTLDDRWTDDYKQGYTVVNLKADPVDLPGEDSTMLEKEENLSRHNRGKCFKLGLGAFGNQIFSEGYLDSAGCVKVPMTIEVEYQCEQYVETTDSRGLKVWELRNDSCLQKNCVAIDVMIQPRIPPKVIPKELLETSVGVLNATINLIDTVLDPLKIATEAVLVTCFGLWAVWLFMKISEFVSCNPIGTAFKTIAGDEGLDTDSCYEYCDYEGEGTVECSGSDDDNTCKSCVEAQMRTKKVWNFLKLACDRVMCPAVPSLEKFKAEQGKEFCAGDDLADIYQDLPQKYEPEDEECKELLDYPLRNQKKTCCAEAYMDKWDSGCLLMNELRESGCIASKNNPDLEPQDLCGKWGNLFSGVADFKLCKPEDTATIERNIDGQWFILEREGDLTEKDIESLGEEYKGLQNWKLYLASSEITIEKDKEGNVLDESSKREPVGKALLSTSKGGDSTYKCEDIKKLKLGEDDSNWPKYKTTVNQIVTKVPGVKKGSFVEQGDPQQYTQEGSTVIQITSKPIPKVLVDEICSGVGGKDYIVDPTSGLLRSIQCGCLSSTYAYLKQYREILNIVRTCFQTILVTGDGSAGVCRAVISVYICDAIYYALQCVKQYSGSGYGKNVRGGIGNFFKFVAGAGRSVAQGVEGRYGATNLFKVMFVEKKVIHAACLFAFTGDWEIDVESLFTAATSIPIESTVGIAPATRRFMSYDPLTGYSTHVYHLGVLIVSGADDLRYNVELICSSDNSCNPADGFAGGVCDCAHGGGERKAMVTGQFGNGMLGSAETLNEEQYIQMYAGSTGSNLRYDKARITYTYTGNDGERKEKIKEVSISQIGGNPPAECQFDIGSLSFMCGFGFGAYKGDAWFTQFGDDNIDSNGLYKYYLYQGSTIPPFDYKITLEGEKEGRPIDKWLLLDLKTPKGTVSNEKRLTYTGDYALNKWPNLRISSEQFTISRTVLKCKSDFGDMTIDPNQDSSCQINLALTYSSGKWTAYKWTGGTTNPVKGEQLSGISCSSEGKRVTCENSAATEVVSFAITTEPIEGGDIYLTGSKQAVTKTCDTEPETWTATYTLHYPKMDTSGNILAEKGGVVVHEGQPQKKTVVFQVYCTESQGQKEVTGWAGAAVGTAAVGEADEEVTRLNRAAVDNYVLSKGGTPSDWMLTSNKDFICVNTNGCSFSGADVPGKILSYTYKDTFSSPPDLFGRYLIDIDVSVDGSYVWPLSMSYEGKYVITSCFGCRCLIDGSNETECQSLSQTCSELIPTATNLVPDMHYGVDIRAAVNSDVKSISDGKIIEINRRDEGYAGRYVKIDNNGEMIMYSHLASIPQELTVAGSVTKGQVIAKSGDSGNVVPHLDIRIYRNGQWIDPLNPVNDIFNGRNTAFEYKNDANCVYNSQNYDYVS